MCFSGVCRYELWSGECGKRPNDPCPMAFESEDEYWEAEENKNKYEENYECSRY